MKCFQRFSIFFYKLIEIYLVNVFLSSIPCDIVRIFTNLRCHKIVLGTDYYHHIDPGLSEIENVAGWVFVRGDTINVYVGVVGRKYVLITIE